MDAHTHSLRKQEIGGTLTLGCATHDWSVVAASPADRRWQIAALAEHVGTTVDQVSAMLVHLFPVFTEPCHEICFDEHGHSDGCLYDDGAG